MANEYTPTTEDVREAYPHAALLPPFYDPEHAAVVAEKHEEFDRWLAEHDREVCLEPEIEWEYACRYPGGGDDVERLGWCCVGQVACGRQLLCRRVGAWEEV